MSTPPPHCCQLHWGAEALWQRLEPWLPGLSVEVVAQADSTNTRLLDRARRTGDTQPCLWVAEHQTAGRGRLGRDWHASAGASLTFSLALTLATLLAGFFAGVGFFIADLTFSRRAACWPASPRP